MLQLFDKNKNKISGLIEYKDLCIESVLEDGDKTLSFLYSKNSKYYFDIEEEGYIRTKQDEFVIKEKDIQDNYTTFICKLNVEELEGKTFDRYESIEQTITVALNLAIVGTGWTVAENSLKKKRTVRKTNCSSWDIIKEIKSTYRVDIIFNTLEKKIEIYEHLGKDKGTYFIEDLNLKSLQVQSNSYSYVTRIIPVGKDGLTIESINNNKNYVENYQYSNKVKTIYWNDDRYTIKESLLEDAKAKLNELSKPYRAYTASIINLSKLNPKYNILDYKLGDDITLISKRNKIKEKQRIIKTIEYPQDHSKDTVELANATLKFEDMQSQFQDAADTVDNVTLDDGTLDGEAFEDGGISSNKIENFKANVIEAAEIHVIKADIQDLNTEVLKAGQAILTKVDTTQLNALESKLQHALIGKADVNELNVAVERVGILEGKTLSVENQLAGNLTAENFKANAITAGSGIIADGAIGSAQISDLDVNKLNAGALDTSKIQILGPNGRFRIIGNKLQVLDDKNGKLFERIMLGVDDNNKSTLALRGKDGQTTLIDENGLTDAGFTNGYGKVNDNSLDASKFDKNSIVRQVNGSTETIKGTKVQIGDRTLDVELSTQKNTVTEQGKELSTQKASIEALDNAIKLKVDNQTFTQSTETIKGNINNLNSDLVSKINTSLNNAKSYADSKKQEAIKSSNDYANNIATTKANNALNSAKDFTTAQITTTNSNLSKATSEINVLKGQISTKVGQSDVENSIIKAKITNYGYAYKKDIIIFGDYNLYYPVVIKGGNQDVKRKIFINRSYSEQAPPEWNPSLATHHGGLSLLISTNFGGWGGANYSWSIYDLEEQYSRMFAGAVNCASNMAFAIFLRGGGKNGAIYHLYSDQPLDNSIGWEKEDIPKPPSPQIAYKGEMISFYKPAYEFYAPKPRTITTEVEEEIKKRKFIQLTQDNATEITIANNKISDVSTSLTQTKNSLQASVNSLNSTTQTITINLTNATNDLNNKINIVKTDAIAYADNAATSKSNEALNNAKAYTNIQINSVNTKVSNAESSINILKNQISTKVSQSDIDKTVNNIKIGGRNLALDTSLDFTAPYKSFNGGENICPFLAKVLTKGLKLGDKITIRLIYSYENIVPVEGKQAQCWIQGCGDITGWGSGAFYGSPGKTIKGTGEIEFLYTIEINAEHLKNTCWETNIRHDYVKSGNVRWKELKVEKGKFATDWTPAPEDLNQKIQDNINNVNQKINTTTSEFTQKTNSISQKVNQVESTTNSLNGKITSNTNRIANAESKITPTAIINSVNSSIGSGGVIRGTSTILDNNKFTVKDTDNSRVELEKGCITAFNGSNKRTYYMNENEIGICAKDNSDSLGMLSSVYKNTLNDFVSKLTPGGSIKGVGLFAGDYAQFLTFGHDNLWGNDSRYDEYLTFNKKGYAHFGVGVDFANNEIQNVPKINFKQSQSTLINALAITRGQVNVNTEDGDLWLNYAKGPDTYDKGIKNVNVRIGAGWNSSHHGSLICQDLWVHGNKHNIVNTKELGFIGLHAYEMAAPQFGDNGGGIVNEDGYCYIYLDPIFVKTVNTNVEYRVHIDIISDDLNAKVQCCLKKPDYFKVIGTPGTKFDWEVKCKRSGYENNRLDRINEHIKTDSGVNSETLGSISDFSKANSITTEEILTQTIDRSYINKNKVTDDLINIITETNKNTYLLQEVI